MTIEFHFPPGSDGTIYEDGVEIGSVHHLPEGFFTMLREDPEESGISGRTIEVVAENLRQYRRVGKCWIVRTRTEEKAIRLVFEEHPEIPRTDYTGNCSLEAKLIAAGSSDTWGKEELS